MTVNGVVIKELGALFDPANDKLKVDGKLYDLEGPPKVYWLLHKPDQVLTSRSSEKERKTIYDLPKLQKLKFLISPVGRLDFRTEGLLLLTNDGELSYRLCHPKYEIPRTYHVLVNGRLSPEEEEQVRKGFELEDGPTGEISIRFFHGKKMGATKGYWYMVSVKEGRNRFVRRIFEHFNHKVVKLIRVNFGGIELPETLKPGDYVQLSGEQIRMLKKMTDMVSSARSTFRS